jgi:hypothetical protein
MEYKYVDYVSMMVLGLSCQRGVQPCNEICIFWQQKQSAVHWAPSWNRGVNGTSRTGNETLTNTRPYSATLCGRSVELLWCHTCWGILERGALLTPFNRIFPYHTDHPSWQKPYPGRDIIVLVWNGQAGPAIVPVPHGLARIVL